MEDLSKRFSWQQNKEQLLYQFNNLHKAYTWRFENWETAFVSEATFRKS